MNRALWTLQVLLGPFFALASSAPKLLLPPEMLPPMPIPLSRPFILFIGVAELAGALGLILPGLTHIRPGLTPLAAAGLVLITIGATGYWLLAGDAIGNAIFAAVIGVLCAFVAYGRWQLVPHRERSQMAALQRGS
jgi:DoxX-like family